MMSKRIRQFRFYGLIKENGTGIGGRGIHVCLWKRTHSRIHSFLLTDAEQRGESGEMYGVRKKDVGLLNCPVFLEGGGQRLKRVKTVNLFVSTWKCGALAWERSRGFQESQTFVP